MSETTLLSHSQAALQESPSQKLRSELAVPDVSALIQILQPD